MKPVETTSLGAGAADYADARISECICAGAAVDAALAPDAA